MFFVIKNTQRLASPKALVRTVPALLLLLSRLPEFCFFRFSLDKTYWNCLSVLQKGAGKPKCFSLGMKATHKPK